MKLMLMFCSIICIALTACTSQSEKQPNNASSNDTTTLSSIILQDTLQEIKEVKPEDLIIRKEFLYDQYTLEDVYPYKDTTRQFQWDKIRAGLALLENTQEKPVTWGVMNNRRNVNGVGALVKQYSKNEYNLIVDTFGIPRFQGIPMYTLTDTITPERYGTDGSLVTVIGNEGKFIKVSALYQKGEWYVPSKYVKIINPDTAFYFKKVIFADRTNQNIMSLEKSGTEWLVRSMNPATTGQRKPPYSHRTPLGIFVIQAKQVKMVFLKDGTTETGGFAPFASRFSYGAYIHGVPVNEPRTTNIEYSQTLGTIPRSHMCVRNATSHAEYIFKWAPVYQSLVFVIE